MSTHELKPGDRVRVTEEGLGHAYLPGDKGTVRQGGIRIGRNVYYTVKMDDPEPDNIAVFTADEIEPDV